MNHSLRIISSKDIRRMMMQPPPQQPDKTRREFCRSNPMFSVVTTLFRLSCGQEMLVEFEQREGFFEQREAFGSAGIRPPQQIACLLVQN